MGICFLGYEIASPPPAVRNDNVKEKNGNYSEKTTLCDLYEKVDY